MSDLLGDIGLGAVAASLAPNDQSHLRGERLAQGQRRGIAIDALAPHTAIMPELDVADKAILVELLRETIERDRFPFSPRNKSLKAVLAKLDPPAPRPEPLPPPKPPGERSTVLAKKRRR